MTALCWLLALPAVAWAVIRIGGIEVGPLVQLMAFTPYAAAWSPVPIVVAAALRQWLPAGMAAVAAAALLVCVMPRAIADGEPAGPGGGRAVRVLTANLYGGGASPAAVLTLVRERRPDVLAVQELTPRTLALLDAQGLAEMLPYRIASPDASPAGSGLFARFPLVDAGVRTNAGGFRQAYATLLVPGAVPVVVESVHPCAPYALRQLRCWRTDLRDQPPATVDGPVRLLAGDFNATLDHAPLRHLLRTGYRDAAATIGAGLTGTWGPYDGDPIPPVTIDHVLVDRRVGVRSVSVHGLAGGDHRAVLAELLLPTAPRSVGGRIPDGQRDRRATPRRSRTFPSIKEFLSQLIDQLRQELLDRRGEGGNGEKGGVLGQQGG